MNKPLHRFALFLALWTLLLVVAGGLVTSNDAGLSVPDWPLSMLLVAMSVWLWMKWLGISPAGGQRQSRMPGVAGRRYGEVRDMKVETRFIAAAGTRGGCHVFAALTRTRLSSRVPPCVFCYTTGITLLCER